jgi:hypothetical protein
MLELARISSYVGFIMSYTIFALSIICVLSAAYILLVILKSKPDYKTYALASRYYILFYAFNEVIKLFFFIHATRTITDYMINSAEAVSQFYTNHNLLMIFYWSDSITTLLGIFFYVCILLKKSESIKLIDGIIVGLFLIILFLVFHPDFFNKLLNL